MQCNSKHTNKSTQNKNDRAVLCDIAFLMRPAFSKHWLSKYRIHRIDILLLLGIRNVFKKVQL